MTLFVERLPAGWRLDSITWAPGPTYTADLTMDTVHVQGTADTFEDALDLALQRAREFEPVKPYLGRLASCRRDSEGRWLMEALDGTIAGHQSPHRAAELLGLTWNPAG